MKLVDTNVLLYAVDTSASKHEAAHTWLSKALGGAETVGFPWVVVLGFIRLATHPSIQTHPLTPSRAIDIVDEWLTRPPAAVLEPAASHLATLRPLLEATGTGGNLVTDAHLAALARQYGATVVTYDNDFDRFEGVRRQEPA